MQNLLTTLGDLDPDSTNLIHFNVENYKSRLPHKLAFQIITKVVGKKVFRTVLDEGASTSVLSLSCWKALSSPKLVTSPTTLKDFEGWGFCYTPEWHLSVRVLISLMSAHKRTLMN